MNLLQYFGSGEGFNAVVRQLAPGWSGGGLLA